jgi:hypothetical protein
MTPTTAVLSTFSNIEKHNGGEWDIILFVLMHALSCNKFIFSP